LSQGRKEVDDGGEQDKHVAHIDGGGGAVVASLFFFFGWQNLLYPR
jgi:hypothetical protein